MRQRLREGLQTKRPTLAHARVAATLARRLSGMEAATAINIEVVANSLDVEPRRRDMRAARGGCRALLQPVTGGFIAWLDAMPLSGDRARRRERFLLAHELGHTLFYEDSDRPSRRGLPEPDAEEDYCNRFAEALLLPPRAVAKKPLHAKAVFELAREFDVSAETAARALLNNHPRCVGMALGWTTGRDFAVQWVGGREGVAAQRALLSRGQSPRARLCPAGRVSRFDSELHNQTAAAIWT